MNLNKVLIYGNLARDPEMKSLPSGISISTFSIATNRVWNDKDGQKQERADFHNIVVFGRQAETVSQYLKKGSSALIEGRLQTRSWDADDGTKRYKTEIVADRVQFGPRAGGSSGGGAMNTNAPSSQPAPSGGAKKKEELDTIQYPDDEDDIDPDSIPF